MPRAKHITALYFRPRANTEWRLVADFAGDDTESHYATVYTWARALAVDGAECNLFAMDDWSGSAPLTMPARDAAAFASAPLGSAEPLRVVVLADYGRGEHGTLDGVYLLFPWLARVIMDDGTLRPYRIGELALETNAEPNAEPRGVDHVA